MTRKYKFDILRNEESENNYRLSNYEFSDGSFITNTPISEEKFEIIKVCKSLINSMDSALTKLKITIEKY